MDDPRADRGDPWEHDPGPPRNRSWARLFAETPGHSGNGSPRAGWCFGPVFYRGRLGDRQVRVLVVGDGGGPDEALAHRAFVGEPGVRLQHLLAHIGITRSYLFLNCLEVCPRVLDYARARNDLSLVLAVGTTGRRAVREWQRSRGGRAMGSHVPVVDVLAPGQDGDAEVARSFGAAVRRILETLVADHPAWLPIDPGGERRAAAAYAYGRAPVPHRDLPFGAPWALGSGRPVARWADGGRSIEIGPAPWGPGAHDFPREPSGGGRAGYDDEPGDLPHEPPRAVVEFDRAPDAATCRLLTGGRAGLPWPDFGDIGVPGAPAYGHGPLYRGRFAGIRLLVLADQAGHDDLAWGRAFTGDAGQHFQALLAALGITRSYLIVRTLPVDTVGLSAGHVWALADRPDVVALHGAIAGRLLDDNPVSAVVTIGPHAQRIAGRLELEEQPVVSLPQWGTEGAAAEWRRGHARLRSLGIPIDQTPTAAHYDGERLQIPRADLAYGCVRWQGSSGDRVVRSRPQRSGAGDDAPAAYKVFAPRWVAPRWAELDGE